MVLYDSSKTILDLLYLLSGPLLVLLGLFGLYQLKIAKSAIVINSKRQAAELAARQVDVYLKSIISSVDLFHAKEHELNLDKLKLDYTSWKHDSVISQLGEEKALKELEVRVKTLRHMLEVVNSMEAFAMYFTKGVADEEIAFSSVGKSFCHSAESIYFLVSYGRKDEHSFQNLIELYQLWNSRLEKEKLTKDKDAIMENLRSLSSKIIKPVGT